LEAFLAKGIQPAVNTILFEIQNQNQMMYYFTEENIFIFLIQVFLLLGSARILGEVFRKCKQPALTAEIIVGIALGPTILGRFLPNLYQAIFPANSTQQNMLETVAWLGLLFFLLETGLKMDFSSAWRHRGKALVIALTDIVFPMTIAFTASMFLPSTYLVDPEQRIFFALFMAVVMTISAMPITIRALSDLDLSKTDLGFLIMSALSVNEIIFTFILRLFIPMNLGLGGIAASLLAIIGFIIVCLTIGRKFTDFIIAKIRKYDLPEPGSSLTYICLLGMFCGAVFQKLGIHALIGFFIAGIMAGEAKALPERTRQVISQMVYAMFIPLFFTGIGLKMDFFRSFDIVLVLFVSVIGILGKFIGAWFGAKFAKVSNEDILPVAIAHIPGGSMEIVIGILALHYRLINEPVFVAIVFGAVVSSSLLGPWLKYAVNRRKEIKILEYFSRSNVIFNLHATDTNNAIRELSAVVSEQHAMPNLDTLYYAVSQREKSMGTAVEKGLVLPHARIQALIKPVVAFGRSEIGIDWDSPDGNPSHFIFLILTPKDNDWAQVQILRIIAKTIDREELRKSILKANDPKALWDILEEAFTDHHIIKKLG
jgi:Kef-type K+ transport system membrane component KefB/mannitol/fructose-specific phosphotransferase system IIA component (Ntr-type)